MIKKTFIFAFIVSLFACTQAPPNPYFVEEDQVKKRVKTIGLMPPNLQLNTGRNERITQILEKLVTEKLEAAGYKVIPSSNYSEIYNKFKSASGQLFDPKTGEPLQDKLAAVHEQTQKVYQTKNMLDATATFGVYLRNVRYLSYMAEWDGTKEPVTGKDGFVGIMMTPHDTGSVSAISFGIGLHNIDDSLMYERFGGVQLLSHVKGKDFLSVPMNRVLVDQEKITNAIEYAMNPLLNK